MDVTNFLELLKIIIWPLTVLAVVLMLRGYLGPLLPRSKIKVSLFGIEIETTLAKLESATMASVGGELDSRQLELLRTLEREGRVRYQDGVPKEDREWVRPIMNAGLISTEPQEAHLGKANALVLTPLGRLLVQHQTMSQVK